MEKLKITKPFAFAHRGVQVVNYDGASEDVPEDAAQWALTHGYAERATEPAENKDAARQPRAVKRNART